MAMNTIEWWRQITHMLSLVCYTASNVINYVHTLLLCYSQAYHEISQETLLAHVCKCQVKIELYPMTTQLNVIKDLEGILLGIKIFVAWAKKFNCLG